MLFKLIFIMIALIVIVKLFKAILFSSNDKVINTMKHFSSKHYPQLISKTEEAKRLPVKGKEY